MLQFDPGCGRCEVPVGVNGISLLLPGGDFVDEVLVVDAAIEIKPAAVLWRVMPFEAFDQTPCFGGGKGLIERCLAVDVEIVLNRSSERGGSGYRPNLSGRWHNPQRCDGP